MALLGPDDGTLVGALTAVDRLVVSTGMLLHGPFIAGLPLSRALDATLLAQTIGTGFGGIWALLLLLLLLVAVLRAWARQEAGWMRTNAWMAVGALAAALVVTPALSGHAAAGPDAALGAVVGVLHFLAAAVWFGGVVLLGTCILPRPDGSMLQAAPRFSSVAFMAMVVVVTGMMQSWRQVGSLQALERTAYGRLPVAKLAVFLLPIAVAGRSRVLVRRELMARALAGAKAPDRQTSDTMHPDLSDDADNGSLWLRRRLVLAEVIIAVVVLAVTALLGIATPPRTVEK